LIRKTLFNGWILKSACGEINAMLSGGCFCGSIRYEATGTPFNETSCHCSICRRTTGAPFVVWFSVQRTQFQLMGGEPTRLRSTAHGTRSFCPRCGTQLTFEDDNYPDEIDVTTCSLDAPNALPPRDHTHASSKVHWVALCDGLPAFPASRGHDA
jgi:hypothetical protein